MKTTAALLFGLSLFLTQAHASKYFYTPESQCTPIDFRQIFPMKMRDQHDLGWCYAHAASDYLQYAYQLPVQVSAADIAINYSKSNLSRFLNFFTQIFSREMRGQPAQTGLVKKAVKMILPQGYCPESAFPSDEWTRVDPQDQHRGKQEILQSIMDTFALQKRIHNGVIKNVDQLPYYYEFKNIDRDRYFSLLKNSSKKRLLENMRIAACRNERAPFPNQQVGLNFQFRTRYAFQSINASFDRGMPVVIDFFSDVLKRYDHPKRNLGSLHTVLLYARKFDPVAQECTYMIKNSYGDDCSKAGTDGRPYDPKIVCEGGNIWLPESKMFRAMTSRLIFYR